MYMEVKCVSDIFYSNILHFFWLKRHFMSYLVDFVIVIW